MRERGKGHDNERGEGQRTATGEEEEGGNETKGRRGQGAQANGEDDRPTMTTAPRRERGREHETRGGQRDGTPNDTPPTTSLMSNCSWGGLMGGTTMGRHEGRGDEEGGGTKRRQGHELTTGRGTRDDGNERGRDHHHHHHPPQPVQHPAPPPRA